MNQTFTRRRFAACATGASLWLATGMASAAEADYPSRPIKVLIGFAPGGGADAVARLVSVALAEELHSTVIVDNRPGANANIATDLVVHAPADGYTLLYNTSSIAISPFLYNRLSYDLKRDLVPVAMAAAIPLILVASPKLPVKNMGEFVAYLKAHDDKLSFASSSTGNITHLAAAELLRITGVKANHVPYKSEAPAITDLLGGQVDFYIGNANTLIPQIRSQRLTALAATSLRRLPQLPELPTLAETVAPGLEMVAWSGFMAPRATAAPIVAKLASALEKVLASPALKARIEASGAEVRFVGSQAYGQWIDAEVQRWGKAVKAAGVQPE